MNNGNICISICAKTADELFKKVERAEPLADLIELRFDCLEPSEIKTVLKRIADLPEMSNTLIATYRTPEQGGMRKISEDERDRFWNGGNSSLFFGGDLEEDVIEASLAANWKNRICSRHAQSGKIFDPEAAYDDLSKTGASVIKIASFSDEAADAIEVWTLINRADQDGKPMIPIAMGEAGKWTRILGLAHGAFLTYASLESGSETAPGQISADEMIDIFRVKEINKETEVYGIVAADTSYSVSPWMQNAAFKATEMNRVFVPFQTTDLDRFIDRMVEPDTREVELNLAGFSVTNPHKRAIIQHLDFIEPAAKAIGAVNTVKIIDGKLHGYNTDAPGFIAPLIKVRGDVKGARVAIVGAGGAARACAYVLKQGGAKVTIFARRQKRAAALAEEFGIKEGSSKHSFRPGTVDILVNATPLGTKGPLQDASIAVASQMNGIKLVYDLVYNPIETRLISEARKAGVAALGGLDMLLAQGARQFEIWTGEKAPLDPIRKAILKKLK
ncbi:MAG: shikimate dehydrogenase [Pyrinomonadaceae bacterium]